MVVPKDFERLKYNYKRLSEYLPGRNIYFVGTNGIAVVNIDNGYGAGYLATQINRLAAGTDEKGN